MYNERKNERVDRYIKAARERIFRDMPEDECWADLVEAGALPFEAHNAIVAAKILGPLPERTHR